MATALDYSAGRPSAAAVKAAQHSGVVRYIGTPGRTKNLTATEYRDMTSQGVGVALVYENHAGDAAGGYAAGQTAARTARADANSVGFPSSRPIYFAVDSDQVTAANFAAVMSYLDGAASVLGLDNVGVYGEYDVIEKAVGPHARYGWQTAAWSGGKRSGKAALFQRLGQIYVGGIQVDVNDILAPDWGQHNAQEDDDMPSAQEVATAVWGAVIKNKSNGNPDPASENLGWTLRGIDVANAKLDAVSKTLGDLALKVAAQQSVPVADLVSGIVAGLAPVVTAALADVDGLDETAVAAKLAADLASRLAA